MSSFWFQELQQCDAPVQKLYFYFYIFKRMMPGHHLEQAVPGQNKLIMGISGSEWCKGWNTVDTLSAPLISLCLLCSTSNV